MECRHFASVQMKSSLATPPSCSNIFKKSMEHTGHSLSREPRPTPKNTKWTWAPSSQPPPPRPLLPSVRLHPTSRYLSPNPRNPSRRRSLSIVLSSPALRLPVRIWSSLRMLLRHLRSSSPAIPIPLCRLFRARLLVSSIILLANSCLFSCLSSSLSLFLYVAVQFQIIGRSHKNADVAQLVERLFRKQQGVSSILTISSKSQSHKGL